MKSFLKWIGNERKSDKKGLLLGFVTKRDVYELGRKVESYDELIKSLRSIIELQGLTNRQREVAFHMARKIAIDAIRQAEELEVKVSDLLKKQEEQK
jgi:hypothetical protein